MAILKGRSAKQYPHRVSCLFYVAISMQTMKKLLSVDKQWLNSSVWAEAALYTQREAVSDSHGARMWLSKTQEE